MAQTSLSFHEMPDNQLTFFPSDVSYKSHGAVVNELSSGSFADDMVDFVVYDRAIPEPSAPCETRVMLSHSDISVDGPYTLDWIDHQVVDAVASIFLYQEYCTASMIYRVMTGKRKGAHLSEAQKAIVIHSMDKLAKSTVTISLPPQSIETGSGPKIPMQLEFSGQMISFEKVAAKTDTSTEAIYRILVVPALFRYARSIGRISEFPLGMMDTPPAKTESILLVQEYLLHRIDAMNRQETAVAPILWRDIRDVGKWVAKTNGTKKVQDSRIRKLVKEILDHWVKYNFILSYSVDNNANGGIRIKPNYQFHGPSLLENSAL